MSRSDILYTIDESDFSASDRTRPVKNGFHVTPPSSDSSM